MKIALRCALFSERRKYVVYCKCLILLHPQDWHQRLSEVFVQGPAVNVRRKICKKSSEHCRQNTKRSGEKSWHISGTGTELVRRAEEEWADRRGSSSSFACYLGLWYSEKVNCYITCEYELVTNKRL